MHLSFLVMLMYICMMMLYNYIINSTTLLLNIQRSVCQIDKSVERITDINQVEKPN